MSIAEYKESIKNLIDNIQSEALLKAWKLQLERDVQQEHEVEFSEEEWNLVQEGLEDYANNNMISFEDFISKRKGTLTI